MQGQRNDKVGSGIAPGWDKSKADRPDGPTFDVIVPAHQAASDIAACLNAIMAAGFRDTEILVVDDGSRDGTGDIARAAGIRVIRNETALRPARARNTGVAATSAEVIVFVDADVLITPGSRARIAAFFDENPDFAALFGSYDDSPAASRPVSRYRNLLHHFVHQHSRPDAATFWTGFGAVRRIAFEAEGGLDPAWENIEDVEFGLRLKQSGARIQLDRDLLCKHLKDWNIKAMFRTDWKGRAVPWTRLLSRRRARKGDLNLSRSHQISAAFVAMFPFALLASAFWPSALWLALTCLVGFVTVNGQFFALTLRRGGIWFALCAVGFHAIHYVAALFGYAQVKIIDPIVATRR